MVGEGDEVLEGRHGASWGKIYATEVVGGRCAHSRRREAEMTLCWGARVWGSVPWGKGKDAPAVVFAGRHGGQKQVWLFASRHFGEELGIE